MVDGTVNVGDLLRDGDPVAREGGLSADHVDAMRQAVIAAALDRRATTWWPGPLFVAATVAATLVAGVALGRLLPARDRTTSMLARRASVGTSAARGNVGEDVKTQLQFATPGGTRIIWVFDPDFNP